MEYETLDLDLNQARPCLVGAVHVGSPARSTRWKPNCSEGSDLPPGYGTHCGKAGGGCVEGRNQKRMVDGETQPHGEFSATARINRELEI